MTPIDLAQYLANGLYQRPTLIVVFSASIEKLTICTRASRIDFEHMK
jgi:hypothetical protein